MVSFTEVEQQLKQIGCNYTFWGRSEVHELGTVLMVDEKITQAINGYYDGGFALLVVTNYRVLLVDRKPLLLTIEDIRYDMISEVDFNTHIFAAHLHIYTPMRNLVFSSWRMTKLRTAMTQVQQHVFDLRQQMRGAPQPQPVPVVQVTPVLNPYTQVPMLSRRRRYPSLY